MEKMKRLIISMPEEMWEKSKIAAVKEKITHTEYVRRAAAEKMKREAAEVPGKERGPGAKEKQSEAGSAF